MKDWQGNEIPSDARYRIYQDPQSGVWYLSTYGPYPSASGIYTGWHSDYAYGPYPSASGTDTGWHSDYAYDSYDKAVDAMYRLIRPAEIDYRNEKGEPCVS